MTGKLLEVWRKILPVVFVFVLLHFLKDITQDMLQISSPLDLMGNIEEDFSAFSDPAKKIYLYGLGGLSIIAEIVIVLSTPIILRSESSSKLVKWNLLATGYLIAFLGLATFFDPRFPWSVV